MQGVNYYFMRAIGWEYTYCIEEHIERNPSWRGAPVA